jgi:hypothetical protein
MSGPGFATSRCCYPTPIRTKVAPANEDGSILLCWRGHGGFWINTADCRTVIARYRARGRKVRHPATRVPSPSEQR